MAFSLHDFVNETLARMVKGGEPDFQVMQLALRWYEKGVLADADMEAIAALIAEREAEQTAEVEQAADEVAAEPAVDGEGTCEVEADA